MTDQSAVVVLEPTEAMLKAGRDAAQSAHAHSVGWTDEARSVWAAMIAAAPKPTLSGEEWMQRAVDAEEMIREIHYGYGVNYTGKWVVRQTGRYLDQLAALSSPLPGEPG